MDQSSCPDRYYLNENDQCVHYLFPLSLMTIVGSFLISFIAGLSSMAGLGGGGPSLVVYILFFNYVPKQANFVVFTSILGATMGNFINQMRKSHNGQPLIKYKYTFVSLPIMFLGSFLGVYLNKILPSLVICSIILYQSFHSLPKIKQRFYASYEQQSKQLLLYHQTKIQDRKSIIKQEIINPFSNPDNRYIFLNITALVAIFTLFIFIRGTEKVPSLIGIQPCSFSYWLMLLVSLIVVAAFAQRNLRILQVWMAPSQSMSDQLKQNAPELNQIANFKKDIIYYSIMAGVFSGFGLGGGLFLVPMYRCLNCTPLEATASTTFTILITAFINCIQGISLGIITVSDFLYFIIIAGGGSYIISVALSNYLRKRNRLSYVEGLLYILITLAVINIPISLLLRYINSGYDSSLILSFGSLC